MGGTSAQSDGRTPGRWPGLHCSYISDTKIRYDDSGKDENCKDNGGFYESIAVENVDTLLCVCYTVKK